MGTGGPRCRLLYVSVQEDVQLGDRLVTSGEGGVFPKGLPVGRITFVERDPDKVSLAIDVELFVKFSTIEELLVGVEPNGS